jgi:hypothetical protein
VSGADDLLKQARERLRELEETEPDELGQRVELAVGDYFQGRWRGEGTMKTKEGDTFPVYLLWDREGKARFHYRNAALVDEIDAAQPSIGDEIVIVRGEDREYEVEGETRRAYRYAAKVQPSSAPLPALAPGGDQPALRDDDIPF